MQWFSNCWNSQRALWWRYKPSEKYAACSPTAIANRRHLNDCVWRVACDCLYTGSTLKRDPHQGGEMTPILQMVSLNMTCLTRQAAPEAWTGMECVNQFLKWSMAMASIKAPRDQPDTNWLEVFYRGGHIAVRQPVTCFQGNHHSVWPLTSYSTSLVFPILMYKGKSWTCSSTFPSHSEMLWSLI